MSDLAEGRSECLSWLAQSWRDPGLWLWATKQIQSPGICNFGHRQGAGLGTEKGEQSSRPESERHSARDPPQPGWQAGDHQGQSVKIRTRIPVLCSGVECRVGTWNRFPEGLLGLLIGTWTPIWNTGRWPCSHSGLHKGLQKLLSQKAAETTPGLRKLKRSGGQKSKTSSLREKTVRGPGKRTQEEPAEQCAGRV